MDANYCVNLFPIIYGAGVTVFSVFLLRFIKGWVVDLVIVVFIYELQVSCKVLKLYYNSIKCWKKAIKNKQFIYNPKSKIILNLQSVI